MKNPRQILLERHRPAESKLDLIRENICASLTARGAHPTPANENSHRPLTSLREFVRSCRWHLAGLSAAWGIVLLLNAHPGPDEAPRLITRDNSPSRPLLATLRENRRQIAELLESPASWPAPEPPSFVPKPRGEILCNRATA